MKTDSELARIAEVARGGSGRTPLYRWLRARHDAFAKLVEENRPNWKALAEGFTGLGLTASGGRPLSSEVVRRTWWAVRRDVAAARERHAKPPHPPAAMPATRSAAPREPTPPAPATAPASPAPGGTDALARLRAEIDERSGRKRHG
ncbi:Hypothetical protein RMP42_05786 (plasmid) [Roseomonas mucosa]|nr:Hypothetical protein RMP42_05786 [Roseomonas mucosa]